jgi:hypothetical protein
MQIDIPSSTMQIFHHHPPHRHFTIIHHADIPPDSTNIPPGNAYIPPNEFQREI